MSRGYRKWCGCLAALLVLLAGMQWGAAQGEDVAAIQARGVLRVGVKSDTPGLGYQTADGTFEGLEIDLARRLALELLGDAQAVVFQAVTSKSRGVLVDAGELDVVIATYTAMPERLRMYALSQPYFLDMIGLLVKAESGIEGFEGLEGKLIGVAQSANTRAALEAVALERGIALEFVEYPTFSDIREGLDEGVVDCFAVDEVILAGYMDGTVRLLPELFDPQPYVVLMKQGNDGLLAAVDGMLGAMRESGELDALVTRWGFSPLDWGTLDALTERIFWQAAGN